MSARTSESIPGFDLYATLGVGRDAPPGAVAAAYRARIRRSHPDRSADPWSLERSKRLNVARDWLLDPVRRARYDAAHPPPPAPRRKSGGRQRQAVREASARHARGPRMDASLLELFVARCASLEGRDARRLAARARSAPASIAATQLRAREIARRHGRERAAGETARAALDGLRDRLAGSDAALAAVLGWTALGLAVADVAPREASVLLGPWRAAIDEPEAVRRARQERFARVQGQLLRVGSAAVLVVMATAVLLGLLVTIGIAVGWIAELSPSGLPA